MNNKKIQIIFFLLVSLQVRSQVKTVTGNEFGSFNLFYIDNSITLNNSVIKDTTIEIIQTSLKKISREGKLLFFISNGESYKYYEKPELVTDEILNDLEQSHGERPRELFDKKMIRKILYSKSFSVSENINFYFFLSKSSARNILEKITSFAKTFPKEVSSTLAGDHCLVNVNIYYSDTEGEITEKKLLTALKFNDDNILTRHLTYHIINL